MRGTPRDPTGKSLVVPEGQPLRTPVGREDQAPRVVSNHNFLGCPWVRVDTQDIP